MATVDHVSSRHPEWDEEVDLLVFGSGAGGLAASLFAAKSGLKVLLCEKSAQLGGTTSTSGGIIWIPNNNEAHAAQLGDSEDRARTYLKSELGNLYRSDLIDAYLTSGKDALEFLQTRTDVKFDLIDWPDYHPDREGGVDKGRTLMPRAFDGRQLGREFELVRPPMRQLMLLRGLTLSAEDITDFLNPFRSAGAFARVFKKLARYAGDRLAYSRGTDVRNGNALVARFLLSLRKAGANIWVDAPLQALIKQDDRVVGARVQRSDRITNVRARRGVVLATGGFPQNVAMREEQFGEFVHEHSVAYEGNVGDGIKAALAVGGVLDKDLASPGLWSPASMLETGGQRTTIMYGYLDRGRPGVIAIDPDGRRFVNESSSYHDIVMALHAQQRGRDAAFYFVCDSNFVRKYGLGRIRPFPASPTLRPFVNAGYIQTGQTIEELASKIGISPAALAATIRRYNSDAASGVDTEFGKGSNSYNRLFGDSVEGPNPNLAPIKKPPFIALKIRPATLGTALGLKTNADAAVVTESNKPIPGLYACGNDLASIMRGHYPGGGITIGPAIVFAYRAIQSVLDHGPDPNSSA